LKIIPLGKLFYLNINPNCLRFLSKENEFGHAATRTEGKSHDNRTVLKNLYRYRCLSVETLLSLTSLIMLF
jgi:hypothetical protein